MQNMQNKLTAQEVYEFFLKINTPNLQANIQSNAPAVEIPAVPSLDFKNRRCVYFISAGEADFEDSRMLPINPANPPLSPNGLKKACELETWFSLLNIRKVFCSPSDRAVETARNMIGKKKNVLIKVENGLADARLTVKSQHRSVPQLRQDYTRIDRHYVPLYTNKLLDSAKRAGPYSHVQIPRLTLRTFLNRNCGDIMVVSHNFQIQTMVQMMTDKQLTIDDGSVTKIVQFQGQHYSVVYSNWSKMELDKMIPEMIQPEIKVEEREEED